MASNYGCTLFADSLTLSTSDLTPIGFIPVEIPANVTESGAMALIMLNLGYAQSSGASNFLIEITDGLGGTALSEQFGSGLVPSMGTMINISGVYEIAPKTTPTFDASWSLSRQYNSEVSIVMPRHCLLSVTVYPYIEAESE